MKITDMPTTNVLQNEDSVKDKSLPPVEADRNVDLENGRIKINGVWLELGMSYDEVLEKCKGFVSDHFLFDEPGDAFAEFSDPVFMNMKMFSAKCYFSLMKLYKVKLSLDIDDDCKTSTAEDGYDRYQENITNTALKFVWKASHELNLPIIPQKDYFWCNKRNIGFGASFDRDHMEYGCTLRKENVF